MSITSKVMLWLISIFAIAMIALISIPAKAATAIDYTRDCDKYAVMYCGSMTKEEIIQKLQNGDGQNSAANIQGIFAQFSLNASSIQNANFVNGVVYQNGEVKVGDKVVATNAVTYIRTMGKVSTSKMGSPQAALVSLDNTGKFMFAVMTPCGNPVTGKPVEVPKQAITCDALTVKIIDTKARKVSATVTGTAQNTTISAYKIDFGDGTVANTQTANHTYAKYGKYTIVAHVTGKVYGSNTTVSGPTCTKPVEFKEPAVQSITCTELKRNVFNNEKRYIKVTLSGTAQNTTISAYKIDFGDGTVANTQTAEHIYGQDGTYKIVGYVTGSVDGKTVTVTASGCEQTVTFSQKPEVCPYNPNIPKNSPDCVEELPKTGAGSMLGLIAGVSILGTVGHRIWFIRRMQ